MEPKLQSSGPSKAAFDWTAADAYLFDIDGTLMNTRDGIHYFAFRNAMREVFGFEANIDGVPVHGNTDPGILRAVAAKFGVEGKHFDERLPRVVHLMSEEVRSKTDEVQADICPSIVELLELLYSKGKLLGIVTGNFEAIGWTKLSATGLRKFFAFGSFSDLTELREDIFRNGIAEVKRRLGPAAVAYVVGDTPSDVMAARKAGIPIISVATGIYSHSELSSHQPDLCLKCCAELF